MGNTKTNIDEVKSLIELDEENKNEMFYACKIAERKNLGRVKEHFINTECINQDMINSDYVCRLDRAIKTDNRYYLMLEYCNGGDLDELMEAKNYKVSAQTVHKIMK